MIYKLEDLEKNIKSQLRDLNWDAQRESFEREPRYDQIENKVNLKIEDNVITYNLGEYIFDYPRDTVSDELEEGEGSVFGAFSRYFQIIEKIIARADSIQGRLEHYIKFEQRLVSMLSENLQGVETKYTADKRQLILTIKEAYEKRFSYLKLYEELFTVAKIDAVVNNYVVYKWNGSQADLFRYIHLAMELGLIESDSPAVGEFLRKHVVCRSRTTGEYLPIPSSELKGTFYNKDRKPKLKFVNKLIQAIREKYPE
jgi:hypothetical protein